MTLKSILSQEELACINEVFAISSATNTSMVPISVSMGDVPLSLSSLFSQAKFTLLAEIGQYKLWFPLQLQLDELGQIQPSIGIPEVLDTKGAERSWRMTQAGELVVYSERHQIPLEVLSLSNSGVAVRTVDATDRQDVLDSRLLHLLLPSGTRLDLPVESVRSEQGVTVLKIAPHGEHAHALRQYLFHCHQTQFAHLYREVSV
ncbi:hypothetical protein [Shewanella sp. NIFS-20-20]|uniref:hypothetical protein n=1 Tax=Shewanella sp. NIFS-20-20 TaxID=2853806 RepID=UPI001C460B32|nr:hypothetical protein [Shewanella sp. NIFS-20-20]MBV7315782.1 hypothetical protein [Shewanella sp. NIFS-20-20]